MSVPAFANSVHCPECAGHGFVPEADGQLVPCSCPAGSFVGHEPVAICSECESELDSPFDSCPVCEAMARTAERLEQYGSATERLARMLTRRGDDPVLIQATARTALVTAPAWEFRNTVPGVLSLAVERRVRSAVARTRNRDGAF